MAGTQEKIQLLLSALRKENRGENAAGNRNYPVAIAVVVV